MMTVVFVSNFLTHHQLPFCLEMQKRIGDGFYFIATQQIPKDRVKFGYADMNEDYGFVVCYYKGKEKETLTKYLIDEADAVIIGSAPDSLVYDRINKNKLTFRYAERIFKENYRSLLSPKAWYLQIKNNYVFRKRKYFLLCASAFSARDFSLFLSFINRSYKWGYFTETKEYDVEKLIESKEHSPKVSILWAGRFLGWKHPEYAMRLAKRLNNEGITNYSITMIGNGPLLDDITLSVRNNGLANNISLLGAMKPEDVRTYMEKSDIFIFTSDYNEGWGAVLNEAMNSACAVVVDSGIGSVPFLVDNRVNGIVYKDQDFEGFYQGVKTLMLDTQFRQMIGRNAYETIVGEWSPKVATDRFLELCNELKVSKSFNRYFKGPISRAKRLTNGWFEENERHD